MSTAGQTGNLAVGLVGVGPWGRHILRDLRDLGVTVHAVARSPKSIARARAGGAERIVRHPRDLPDCAGYVVANRTTAHLETIEHLLIRGQPIFCEKPMGTDLSRAERLPVSAQEFVFVMHKWRYHPGILELARIARSGEIGRVIGLRSSRVGWSNSHPDVDPYWTLMPHEIAIALEVLGDVPQPVFAAPDPVGSGHQGAIVHLRSKGDVPVVCEVSARHPVRMRRTVLRCSGGAIVLDSADYSRVLVQHEDDEEVRVCPVATTMPLHAELAAFVDHLRGGPPPKTSFEEELAILRTLTKAQEMIDA